MKMRLFLPAVTQYFLIGSLVSNTIGFIPWYEGSTVAVAE